MFGAANFHVALNFSSCHRNCYFLCVEHDLLFFVNQKYRQILFWLGHRERVKEPSLKKVWKLLP